MLFSQERVGLKVTQSKIAFTVAGYKSIFKRRSITKNHLVKNNVNGAQDKMLFSQEKEDLKHMVKITVNGTQSTMLFS